jgi:hypothetical protein
MLKIISQISFLAVQYVFLVFMQNSDVNLVKNWANKFSQLRLFNISRLWKRKEGGHPYMMVASFLFMIRIKQTWHTCSHLSQWHKNDEIFFPQCTPIDNISDCAWLCIHLYSMYGLYIPKKHIYINTYTYIFILIYRTVPLTSACSTCQREKV